MFEKIFVIAFALSIVFGLAFANSIPGEYTGIIQAMGR